MRMRNQVPALFVRGWTETFNIAALTIILSVLAMEMLYSGFSKHKMATVVEFKISVRDRDRERE